MFLSYCPFTLEETLELPPASAGGIGIEILIFDLMLKLV
jgi:hypothetical protein